MFLFRFKNVPLGLYYHHPNTVSIIADHYDWYLVILHSNACARYVSTFCFLFFCLVI